MTSTRVCRSREGDGLKYARILVRYWAKCDGSRARQADAHQALASGPSREDLVMAAHTTTKSAIGIDIGGTGVKGATVALDTGELTMERVRLLTPEPSTPDAVAEVAAEVLDQIGADGPVGLTLPSVVTDGLVRTAANIDP